MCIILQPNTLLRTVTTVRASGTTFASIARPARTALKLRCMATSMKPVNPIVFYDSGTCPYAQRVWITLLEKGLPFEHRIVDLGNKPKEFTDLYAEINPDPEARAKVPVIIDNGVKLTESMVVLEYLDNQYADLGTKLMPPSAVDKAKVQLFMELCGSRMGAVYGVLRADSADAVAEAKDKLVDTLQLMDKFLRVHGTEEDGSFLLGSRYSAAEAATTPFIRRAVVVLPAARDVDLMQIVKDKGLERLERWIKACLDRPSNKHSGPDDEGLLQSMQKFIVPLTS